MDILKTSRISVIANSKGDGDDGAPRNEFMLAPQQGEGGEWTEKADMLIAGRGSVAVVVDGKIYVVGGTTRNLIPVSTVEVYDPATDTWTKKADMPTPRLGLSTTVVNGKIYAIGGGGLR